VVTACVVMKTGLSFEQYLVSVTSHKHRARFLSNDTFLVLLYRILLSCFLKQTDYTVILCLSL